MIIYFNVILLCLISNCAVSDNSRPTLIEALLAKDTVVVHKLLADGANANMVYLGIPAVHFTVDNYSGCNHELLEAMLKHGASANSISKPSGASLVMAIAKTGDVKCFDLIMNESPILGGSDVTKSTLAYRAAEGGSYDIVKDLLRRGISFDQGDVAGVTPLMIASAKGHQEVVKLLLKIGSIDVFAKEKRGKTACDFAHQFDQAQIVKLLPSCD
jgi:serine/threonine-protein phosphatase 6 regulatory ankyrin repeat subunit B